MSGESSSPPPVFRISEPIQNDISICLESGTTTSRQRKAGLKRLKVPIRDVIFPVRNTQLAYSLTQFFKFGAKQHARLWESMVRKHAESDLKFTNRYRSRVSEDTSSLTIPASTVVLVHPTLALENLDPFYLFLPVTTDGGELEFSMVHVQRKTTEPVNLQVRVNLNVHNPVFSSNGILDTPRTNRTNHHVVPKGLGDIEGVSMPEESDYLASPAIRDTRSSHLVHPQEERKLFHYPCVPLQGVATNGTNGFITINNTDIPCLSDEEYLNDQVMDFWIRHIVEQLSPEDNERCHFFNTFFFKRLTTKPKKKVQRANNSFEYDSSLSAAEKRHARVKNWTKSVDIFKKDFLFIPVNENFHWYLIVICFPGMEVSRNRDVIIQHGRSGEKLPALDENEDPDLDETMENPSKEQGDMETEELGDRTSDSESTRPAPVDASSNSKSGREHPCIVIFDSLGPDNRSKVYTIVREYLEIEYKARKAPAVRRFHWRDMPGYQPSVPLQKNGFDCGSFVLQYMEAFFHTPFVDIAGPNKKQLKDWFPDSAVQSKRDEIYAFIVNFVKTYFPDNVKFIPERKVKVPAGARN